MSKVALVTGGSRGIGKAICHVLAKDGFSIAINYVNSTKDAEELAAELESKYQVKAKAFQADISNVDACKKLINDVSQFGDISCLVNNAGYMKLKKFEESTAEDYEKHFGANVKGPIFLTQEAGKVMKSGSAIVFISCVFLLTVNGTYSMVCDFKCASMRLNAKYVATKGALEQFARSITREYASEKGIRINTVSPGPTATELFLKDKPDELIKKISAGSPWNRIGEPEEVAEAVAFFASDKGKWALGQNLRMSGGQTI